MSKKNRLVNLFRNIPDKDIQEIIASVVNIEQQHRSSSRDNFPIQKIRDAIDSIARNQEMK